MLLSFSKRARGEHLWSLRQRREDDTKRGLFYKSGSLFLEYFFLFPRSIKMWKLLGAAQWVLHLLKDSYSASATSLCFPLNACSAHWSSWNTVRSSQVCCEKMIQLHLIGIYIYIKKKKHSTGESWVLSNPIFFSSSYSISFVCFLIGPGFTLSE